MESPILRGMNRDDTAGADAERLLLDHVGQLRALLEVSEQKRRDVCAALLDVDHYVYALSEAFKRAREACSPD